MGKTLVARLLAEFFHTDGRSVAAFDVNPDDFTLADQLPAYTTIADISDIKGQMALFDQLIVADQTPKVVDLGYGCFEQFFLVMRETGFEAEARRRSVAPVVLFMAEPDRHSTQAFATLHDRFPELPLLPVLTGWAAMAERYRNNFKSKQAVIPLHIPPLAPALRAAIQRSGFSFAAFNSRPVNTTAELYAWTRGIFLQFRELELRLLLEELKPALRLRA